MKIYIIIPTYNERDTIETLIREILELYPHLHLIIVDDNSPDGTGEIVERISCELSSVEILHRPKKLGLGTAYVKGFQKALNDGAEIIFEMDADYSHDPKDIQYFLEAIENADLVIGSRYVDGVRVLGWRFRRLFLSKMSNIYVSHVMIFPRINDYTAGYRCYRRKVLESIDLEKIESDGYAFQIEMVYLAYKNGFKTVELPVIFRERMKGYSKISRNVVREAFFLTLKHHAPIVEIVRTFLSSCRRYLFLE